MGLAMGQSDETKRPWELSGSEAQSGSFLKPEALWRADDPRNANPLNLFQSKNPLNPVNKYHPESDTNPVNKFRPDNPLNPVNRYNPSNLLNPVNRHDPDSPLNPVNRFRSPNDPPRQGWSSFFKDLVGIE